MRRAGRIIYNAAMVVSLLFCLATVSVWVRSYWLEDYFTWYTHLIDPPSLHCNGIWIARGGIQLSSSHFLGRTFVWRGAVKAFIHQRYEASDYPLISYTNDLFLTNGSERYAALGFEIVPPLKRFTTSQGDARFDKTLTLPLYFVSILFALLPAHYFLRVRRRRRSDDRRARGCCLFCGYDLRASPGRCPECGRGVAAEK